MNIQLTKTFRWAKAFAIAVPLVAAQAIVPVVLETGTFGKAQAQEEEAKPEQKTRRTQALNNKVYEKLQEAQQAVEAKNISEAMEILDELQNDGKPLNDYEMANVLNLYAFIYYSQEDFAKAVDAYKRIITLQEAPEGTIAQARYSLAQLYFVTEQYREGVNALLAWFETAQAPGSSAYMLLGQGYYQLQENDLALQNVEKAIAMTKEKGRIPKENWYGLQRFLYYDKEDYRKVVEILSEMLIHYPKKNYWVQLSAMYSELNEESKQLSAMETAYEQQLLNQEKELLNMAYLYLANEVPYKAAKVVDQGIKEKTIEATSKNLELLGNAWRAAQEVKKSIPEMAKAAEKSDKGDIWARLCNIYLDNDEFKKAIESCDKGLKKGGVKRPDTAYLVKGMAHFNLKQYQSARTAFREAAKDKRSKQYADQWIKFMDRELERQKSLEQV